VARSAALLLAVPLAAWADDDDDDANADQPFDRMDDDDDDDDDDEWKRRLSDVQYYVLRKGGTEPRYYSVLVDEARPGTYRCAGCGSNLFASESKFESGTGWPSFAASTPNVEILHSVVPPVVASVLGAGSEIKCRTCRGHVGEVFYDGASYPGTPAALSGRRYCVDGAALVFYPDGAAATTSEPSPLSLVPVRGDQPSDYAATSLD
jgi:peptide-methionine (R)-S-oxide reductase